MAHTSNIDEIMLHVRKAIAKRKTQEENEDFVKLQQPEATSTLNKSFYFFPSN